MAEPTYYKIRVKTLLLAPQHNLIYRPGKDYTVSAALYNDTVDGKPLKDWCESAKPLFPPVK